MNEKEYKEQENPKCFFSVHSAWCPPKRSDLLEIELKRPELSNPAWKDMEDNTINNLNVGHGVKMSVNCNEDTEQNASVVFRLYPDGVDINITEPEATIQGINKNGIAESQNIIWGTKNQYDPPSGNNKFFFTAQTRKSEFITSSVLKWNLPEFSNLLWLKDSQKSEFIYLHEYITISCDTKNIPDDQQVIIEIYEPGERNINEHIFDVKGKVKNNKVAVDWKVDYRDKQHTKSNKEINEKGYSIPEYHFNIRYFGFKSEDSSIGKVKCNYVERAKGKNGNPIKNTDYVLITPDKQRLKGKTDNKGIIRQENIHIGKCHVIIAK